MLNDDTVWSETRDNPFLRRSFLPDPGLPFIHIPEPDFNVYAGIFEGYNGGHPAGIVVECSRAAEDVIRSCAINKPCDSIEELPKLVWKFRVGDEFSDEVNS